MSERHNELRCLIAAGGTAGHVLPSLAVAEALRERGVTVTFAGSPDRVEASLVPEAGYELDTFEISGFPRRPSVALLRRADHRRPGAARVRRDPETATAARRPRRRRVRRRADGLRRLAPEGAGGADRGRRPSRAGEPARGAVRAARLPRVRRSPDATARSTASPGRPVPAAHRGVDAGRRAGAASACPADGPAIAFFGALCRGAQPERLRGRDVRRRRGRPCSTSPASGTTSACAGCVHRDDYVLVPSTTEFGAALAAPDLAVSRAGGTVWELAAAGDARDPRPVPARDRRTTRR